MCARTGVAKTGNRLWSRQHFPMSSSFILDSPAIYLPDLAVYILSTTSGQGQFIPFLLFFLLPKKGRVSASVSHVPKSTISLTLQAVYRKTDNIIPKKNVVASCAKNANPETGFSSALQKCCCCCRWESGIRFGRGGRKKRGVQQQLAC